MLLSDKRMLELAKDSGLTQKEFYTQIGFNHTNISQVRAQKQSFTIEHLANAIRIFELDANYFFKKNAAKYDRKNPLTVRQLLQEALLKIK